MVPHGDSVQITVNHVYIEYGYIKLCPISNVLKIPIKVPCISHPLHQTAPSVLWDILNFPTPGDRNFMASGEQFCSD